MFFQGKTFPVDIVPVISNWAPIYRIPYLRYQNIIFLFMLLDHCLYMMKRF